MSGPDQLAALWLEAKAREAAANAERIEIEQRIIAALGTKPEGSTTHKLTGMSVTLTARMTYGAEDADRLQAAAPELFRASLNESAIKRLRDADPARYRALAPLLVVRPAKVAVNVKLVEVSA